MRRLLTVLVVGALAVTLGAPAFAGDRGSSDHKITAMRDRDDRGHDRHGRDDDDRRRGSYHPDRYDDRDDGYRHHYRHRYGYDYGYYDYYGYPAYYRDSYSRERECRDAYY